MARSRLLPAGLCWNSFVAVDRPKLGASTERGGRHEAEPDDEVAGEVLWLELAAFLQPEPQEGGDWSTTVPAHVRFDQKPAVGSPLNALDVEAF
jgi:hypothetical protein